MTTGAALNVTENLPGPAVLKCIKCNQELKLVTHAQARNVVCPNCHNLFEVRGAGLLTVKQLEKEKVPLVIPIGAKGQLNDVPYQVTGFILYQERDSKAWWREYMLFNPVAGYAFLSEYNGHWNYFHYISDYSHGTWGDKVLNYQGAKFRLFHRYHAKVVFAAGEFSWNITTGNPHYSEFISPPYIITRIVSEKEISWLLGEYYEPDKIKAAFGLEIPMPDRLETGATEVISSGLSFAKIKTLSLAAAGILFALQLLFSMAATEKNVAEKTYMIPPDVSLTDPKPIVGETFTLNSNFTGTSNVEFTMSSMVSNDWLGVGIILFNTRTGQEFEFEMGVEYYFGYDGGEWTEGSRSEDRVFSALPDGEYQMLIRPFKSSAGTANSFYLRVVQDVPLWSNFWVILGLLGIFPGLQYIREQNFEKRRWMNSDYSPYDY